jgi:N-acetylmuramoyl-L-alanine amidase
MPSSVRIRNVVIASVVLFALALPSAVGAAAASTYQVSPGDTLTSIAARYGVSVYELVAANNITDPNFIFAGQNLYVPGQGVNTAPVQTEATSETAVSSYTIQYGDTLWSIASRHQLSVAQLIEANRDLVSDQDVIFPGSELRIPGRGGQSVDAAPAPAQPEPSALTRDQIGIILDKTARAYGLDPALVKAIAWQESGWQQHVVSSSGALGVMQVMPATGGWVATELVGRPLDIANNASENILAGVVYLEWLMRYTGDEALAIASYYQGPGSVSRNGLFLDTEQYVQNVYSLRNHFWTYGTPPI